MTNRLELQTMLETLLGSRNVYYQPPESTKIRYPAIIYSKDNIKNSFADDEVYNQSNVYRLTVIDYDPDSVIFKRVSKLKSAKWVTRYSKDDLNHEIYTIYYK